MRAPSSSDQNLSHALAERAAMKAGGESGVEVAAWTADWLRGGAGGLAGERDLGKLMVAYWWAREAGRLLPAERFEAEAAVAELSATLGRAVKADPSAYGAENPHHAVQLLYELAVASKTIGPGETVVLLGQVGGGDGVGAEMGRTGG